LLVAAALSCYLLLSMVSFFEYFLFNIVIPPRSQPSSSSSQPNLAGSGVNGSSNGQGSSASFNEPSGVAVDSSGYVYVADTGNHLIRKISPSGMVSTLAGSGLLGFAVRRGALRYTDGKTLNTIGSSAAVDGQGVNASFRWPQGVAVDHDGNVYVGDGGNALVRKITPEGLVSTLAGRRDGFITGGMGMAGSINGFILGEMGNKDGPGSSIALNYVLGVLVDSKGYIYVEEDRNPRTFTPIRKISPSGIVSTVRRFNESFDEYFDLEVSSKW
jgi:serine/threonine protein kinase, bacterial